MKSMQLDALINHMTAWVKRTQDLTQRELPELTEDTDLIMAGILDSRSFIEMMMEVEQQTGNQIDLNDVDPGEFTTIKGLCQCALAQV
jgi:acyl carrier protein